MISTNKKVRFFLVITLISVFLSIPTPAFACTHTPPTPWFNETLEIVSTTLPANFPVKMNDAQTIELENDAGAAILMKDQDGNLKKVTDGNLLISLNFSGTSTIDETLYASNRYPDDTDTDIWIPLKSYNVLRDYRPSDPPIPHPQHIIVNLLVGQQSYSMELKISYALSTSYRYNSLDIYQNGCSRAAFWFDPLQLIFGILIAILIVVGLFMILSAKKQPSI